MKLVVLTGPRWRAALIACAFLACQASSQPAAAQEPQAAATQDEDAAADAATSPQAPIVIRDQQVQQYDPLTKTKEDLAAELRALREADKRREQEKPPIPGSIADSETPIGRQPATTDEQNEYGQPHEYAGPAVLTRSYTLGAPSIPKMLQWRESISIGSSYDTGLGQVGPNGSQSAGALTGTTISWSVSGGHAFKRDTILFASSGGESYYPGSSYYTGSNHNLSASWSHIITRRISMQTSFAGAILSANSALSGYSAGPESIANVSLATSPNIGVFDNGSKQATMSTGVNWRITNRWNASANAGYFGVARNSAALYGASGQSVGGDLTYRLTRRMTTGASFSFSQFAYPHGVQNSDSKYLGAVFSYALGRSMQIRFNGGLADTESLGLQTVAIDPLIAAILGVHEGVIQAYQSRRSSSTSAQFARDFRKRGTLSVAYARGITPGNGLFLTSMQESVSITHSETLFRKYSFSILASRDKTAAALQNSGQYVSDSASFSTGHSVGHASMNFAITYRHFEISSLSSLRNQLTISSALSWGSDRLIPTF